MKFTNYEELFKISISSLFIRIINWNNRINMITMVQVECQVCQGDGFEEIIGDCDLPASMCCGGCVKTYKCEECDGLGYVYEDLEEEFED